MIKSFKHKGLKLFYEKGKTAGIQTHPGEFIESVYLEPYGVSCRTLATHLGVAASTLSRIVKGKSAISPEMALRLSKSLGRTPESWLSMQDNYELWRAKQSIDLNTVQRLDLNAA